MNYFKRIIKCFLRDETIKIKKNDVYLASYPKSGNTWMRFLLINYLFNEKQERLVYEDLEKYIPSIHKSTARYINSHKGFRIIKSHFVKTEYPKIIYVLRDGRDALVSYYYYSKDLKGFEGNFEDFYYSDLSSEAGTWDEHLNSAIAYQEKHPKKIIFVKYEDLKSNPHNILSQVIIFLGFKVSQEKLNFAITNSSFNKLKSMQETEGVNIGDKEINFFRKGTSNQWKAYFSKKLNTDFIKKSKGLLMKFNYSEYN